MSEDQPTYRPSTPLMEAICLDDDQEASQWVKELLEAGEDPNARDFVLDCLPLHHAWANGRTELMSLLIQHGADAMLIAELPYDFSFDFMFYPLDSTIVMIEHGFTLDLLYKQNQLGELICSNNLLAEFLEKKCFDDIDTLRPFGVMKFIHVFDELGNAPLGTMARDRHLEEAKWLIQHGADVNAHCEGLIGSTALDRAIESTDVEMTSFLLSVGANPNIPTGMWITATDRAVNFMPDFQFRRKESRVIPDAVKIREMILKASKNFPPPTYPNGSKPKT